MPTKMKLSNINLLHAPGSADLFAGFHSHKYPRKTIIFTPFDDTNSVFIIKSGRLRIYLSYEDKEFTLAFLEEGDVFSTHTRAFVQALEETELLVTTTATLQERLASLPQFSLVMVKVLGELLKNSISTIEDLAFKEVRQRLADFLVQAVEDRGHPAPEGIFVDLRLSTEDIALLIGTTRQTISQLLNDLIKEGIIAKPNRRALLVLKPRELMAWRDSH